MAAAGIASKGFGLFSDEMFTSTDLNRRSGEVLNRARKHPVTIARNNEQFALIRRDQAANLIKALGQIREIVDICQGAVSVKVGIDPSPAVAWMSSLGEEDRIAMLREILTQYSRASEAEDWDSLGDLIHEWKESAAVMQSGAIEQSLSEPSDEQPLTVPVVEDEPETCASSRLI
jgi:hypothetical protein